jgi:hypothetical protein
VAIFVKVVYCRIVWTHFIFFTEISPNHFFATKMTKAALLVPEYFPFIKKLLPPTTPHLVPPYTQFTPQIEMRKFCSVPLDLVLALKDMTAFADCPTGISFLFNGPDQPATATMALVAEEGQVFQRVKVVVQIH